ncbi:MAG TPA: NADH-quinone oxidoreductase subunit M [Bacillales bacterium]|nr:NADH-quinone oxidoreductase subunit M [Bacillales bacterium]
MSDPYFLSILIFSPLLGILVLAVTPKDMEGSLKTVGFLATLLPLALAGIAYVQFDENVSGLQFATSAPWIEVGNPAYSGLVVHYALGVDGLSLLLILLTAVIASLAAAASVKITTGVKGYYMLFLLLEIGMLGVFASQNLLLFFSFFEMTLVPTYFLIRKWGYKEKRKAANTFLIYNGLGSAVMLIAFIVLFAETGTMNIAELQEVAFSELQDSILQYTPVRYGLLFALIAAFGVKLPIFPLHSWMLRVHAEAPVPTVMVHSGILLKIGAYGLIRFGLGIFPVAFADFAYGIAVLGLINLLYGALVAFKQDNFKLVLAYSSVSHMGIVLLGLAAVNASGLQGAVFQVISHGFISALLFFLVGVFYERTKTTDIRHITGLARPMPLASGFLLAGGLASLGLPGMSGFISEFMAFLGLFAHLPVLAAIGTLGILLTAVYVLRAIMNMTYGRTKESLASVLDLRPAEAVQAAIMTGFIILIGVWPSVLANSLQMAVDAILVGIGG